MSIKKIKETYCRKISPKRIATRKSKEGHKIFEQEKISHQFLYSSESSNCLNKYKLTNIY